MVARLGVRLTIAKVPQEREQGSVLRDRPVRRKAMLLKYLTRQALVLSASLAICAPAGAAELYSNLVPDPNLRGDHSVNNANGAILDDVLVDNFINNTTNENFAQVSSVTVGILRDPGAGATTLTGYYGTTTTPVNPNDFPILNNPQTAFGTINVPAFAGSTQTVEFYTITPASPFVVPLNLTDQPTFSEFAIGLQFSNNTGNGWAVAQTDMPDANLDGAWDANLENTTNAAYAQEFNGEPIYTTFALEVNGVAVPEPATAGFVAVVAGLLLGRRNRE
jgi:hypothetical protein